MTYETKRPKFSIYRGLPGSGKSTDARNYQAEQASSRHRNNVVIVERDIIRRELDPEGTLWYQQEFEHKVTTIHAARIRLNLEAGNDVICSDTNLPNQSAKRLAELGVRLGAEVEFVDFRDVPLLTVLANNSQREGTDKFVDPEFITDKWERFIQGKVLTHPDIPTAEELAAQDAAKLLTAEKYVAPLIGVPTVLVDLDGTLADHNGRNPYDTSKYAEDLVNGNVLDIVLGLDRMDYRIDIMTGRDASYEMVIRDWLDKYRVPYTALRMRPAGNTERDDKVKLDLFEKHYRNERDISVQFCIDDRDRVISMYRNVLGLQVFQANYGNF